MADEQLSDGPRRCFIAEHWMSFRESSLADGIGSLQLREMRLSFFAGAVAAFSTMFVQDGGDRDDLQVIHDVDLELHDFKERVRRGEV
jgi:hypothetical protein